MICLLVDMIKESILNHRKSRYSTFSMGSTEARTGFQQIVTDATHIDGGAIDHIYLSQDCSRLEWRLELCPKYYSDHDGLYLTVWKTCGAH